MHVAVGSLPWLGVAQRGVTYAWWHRGTTPSTNNYGTFEFWEMKEYGVQESWVKLFGFSVQALPDVFASVTRWVPVLVTEDGTVVINLYKQEVQWRESWLELNVVEKRGLSVAASDRKCMSDTYTNLCVWNPTTGFFRKIPDPEIFLQNGTSIVYVTFAFGHVMATDDYKLVFFVPADFTVHIFSTRDGSWKVIGFPHSSFPCYIDNDLLVSNGAIHWVSTGIPEAISAFDLGREEFCQLPLPPALIESVRNENGMHADTEDDEDGMDTDYDDDECGRNERRIWTQILKGGRLCVRSHDEYWVMKQYAVPESWVKMFQFSIVDLPNVFASTYGRSPVFVTEGGTVVMRHGMELVRIECHREGKPVCCGQYKINSGRYKITSVREGNYEADMTVYDETLLSV